METPKQQALAAIAGLVQQHRDAIKMAKQQTRDIIARQKAEAKEQALAARKAVEEQLAADEQANRAAESEVIESLQAINGEEDNKGESGQASSSTGSESPQAADVSQERAQPKTPTGLGMGMSPSLQQTISELQRDAALEHQRMLDDIAATMQQQRED